MDHTPCGGAHQSNRSAGRAPRTATLYGNQSNPATGADTLARTPPGICKAGLFCAKSRGRRPVVWLHSSGRSTWAALHTVRRHGGRIEQVVILEIDVPRRWLRRSKKGLWYCPRDMPPERIRGVITIGVLSRSPVKETAAAAS
jgi:hypothetical protein